MKANRTYLGGGKMAVEFELNPSEIANLIQPHLLAEEGFAVAHGQPVEWVVTDNQVCGCRVRFLLEA
jgi:hypothetical protein